MRRRPCLCRRCVVFGIGPIAHKEKSDKMRMTAARACRCMNWLMLFGCCFCGPLDSGVTSTNPHACAALFALSLIGLSFANCPPQVPCPASSATAPSIQPDDLELFWTLLLLLHNQIPMGCGPQSVFTLLSSRADINHRALTCPLGLILPCEQSAVALPLYMDHIHSSKLKVWTVSQNGSQDV